MASKEFSGAETPAALTLDGQQANCAGGAHDEDAVLIGLQDRTRLRELTCLHLAAFRRFNYLSFPNLQQTRLRLGVDCCKSAGPGNQTADPVPDRSGRLRPIKLSILLFNLSGQADPIRRLRFGCAFSVDVIRDGVDKQLSAHLGEAVVKGLRVVRDMNRRGLLGDDVPRIHSHIHFHDGDTRLRFVIEYRPLDRSRATVLRQEGRVNVETAVTREIQNGFRQDLAEGSDGDQVGLERRELVEEYFVTGAFRLKDRDLAACGQLFDGGRLKFEIPAFGPVRLGNDGDDLELASVKQGGEARASQFGRTHENDPERIHRCRIKRPNQT